MQDIATPGLYLTLTGVISILFKLLVDRCYRAEKQVDTIHPLITQMLGLIQTAAEKIASLVDETRALRDEIRDLREQLRIEQGKRP